jgi:hypothetical protein
VGALLLSWSTGLLVKASSLLRPSSIGFGSDNKEAP